MSGVLNAALSVVSSGVKKDKQFVIMRAERGTVQFFARNETTELSIGSCDAEIIREGIVAVPPKKFAQVLAASTGEVEIKSISDGTAVFSCMDWSGSGPNLDRRQLRTKHGQYKNVLTREGHRAAGRERSEAR